MSPPTDRPGSGPADCLAAEELSSVGSLDYDVKSGRVFVDSTVRAMAGLPASDEAVPLDALLGRIHPDDLEHVVAALNACLGQGHREVSMSFRIVCPTGGLREVLTRGLVVRDADGPPRVVGAVVDVTGWRAVESRLRQSEDCFRSILTNSLDVVYRRDLQTDRYDCVSPSVESLTGLTPEEFMAGGIQNTVGRIHPDDLREAVDAVERVMAKAPASGMAEYRYRRTDGAYRWFADHFTVTRGADGRLLHWVGTVRDITDLKEAEARLKQAKEDLETRVRARAAQLAALTAELIGAEEAERERIGHVLHDDLQQILVALRYELEGPPKALGAADCSAAVGIVEQAIRVTRMLSADLLPPMLGEESLERGLGWLAGDMRERFGLTVHLAVAPGFRSPSEPLRLFIYRAVREFLFNVVKHAGVAEADLSVRAREDGRIEITVRDSGAGFSGLITGAGGLGLRRIRDRTELFGGDLCVASAPSGTRVTLVLPER